MRKSIGELEALVGEGVYDVGTLLHAHALSTFIRDCVLAPGYSYPDALEDSLSLQPEGQRVLDLAVNLNPEARHVDCIAAVFAIFSYEDLLFDLNSSNWTSVQAALSDEISARRIQYAFRHATDLYDAYFDRFGTEHIDLTPEDTQALLSVTPQGVFQVGKYCVGPLGLTESSASRLIPPTAIAPLAHCRDPGCPGIHHVALRTGVTSAGEVFSSLLRHLPAEIGARSAFDELIVDLLVPDELHYGDVNSSGLFQLLGNALSEQELRDLLAETIRQFPETRTRLSTNSPDIARSSPENVAACHDRAWLLQALLSASDTEISVALDLLVSTEKIVVPPTEIRRNPAPEVYSSSWQRAEVSSYGIRFDAPGIGTLRLRELILHLHGPRELEWGLMDAEGASIVERLDNSIHGADVRELVDNMLLGSPELFDGTLRLSALRARTSAGFRGGTRSYNPDNSLEARVRCPRLSTASGCTSFTTQRAETWV